MGMRYRAVQTSVIVTNPRGESSRQTVYLTFDTQLKLFEVQPVDGVLKGYLIGILQSELVRTAERGRELEVIPRVP